MIDIFNSTFFDRMTDPDWEPFEREYQQHLRAINQVIYNSGEELEGNVFYSQGSPHVGELASHFRYKRRTLAMLALAHQNILEIGFNAGHSALLMLTANPNLQLTCVDICEHAYTEPCVEYLCQAFPRRIQWIKGDSHDILPKMQQPSPHTAFHIDGGHMIWQAALDLRNCMDLARPGSVILFDDSDDHNLRHMLDFFLISGRLLTLQDINGHLPNTGQMLFVVR